MMRAMLLTGLVVLLMAPGLHAQDDADIDPLAELAALGDAMADVGPEGGGSIRAKKDADLERTKRVKDKRNIEAKVEVVNKSGFPKVALRVKVTKSAKDGSGKAIKRNTVLILLPQMKFENKQIAMDDPATLINAGTFYLKKGDKVVVRLGEQKKGDIWIAEYIERK